MLNEIAHAASIGIEIAEASTPIREEVEDFCEILGLDPPYLANEGRIVCVVPAAEADAALAPCAAGFGVGVSNARIIQRTVAVRYLADLRASSNTGIRAQGSRHVRPVKHLRLRAAAGDERLSAQNGQRNALQMPDADGGARR